MHQLFRFEREIPVQRVAPYALQSEMNEENLSAILILSLSKDRRMSASIAGRPFDKLRNRPGKLHSRRKRQEECQLRNDPLITISSLLPTLLPGSSPIGIGFDRLDIQPVQQPPAPAPEPAPEPEPVKEERSPKKINVTMDYCPICQGTGMIGIPVAEEK